MGKTMRHLNLICFLCLLDFLHGYHCPSSLFLKKNCTIKILHCLPVYPDWTKYVLVCSVAKSFVSGTCPVYFKMERIITSVPCPPIYYTDNIYRSNQIEVPKLKQNCTEEGQKTMFTNSTVNNLCYCVEDYSFQKNETYCDPTSRNCTCHRNKTDVIIIDDSFDLWNIYAPVIVVASILVFIGIAAGWLLKGRHPQLKKIETQVEGEQDTSQDNSAIHVIDVTEDNIIVNYQQSYSSIQVTQDEHPTAMYVNTQPEESRHLLSRNSPTDTKDYANSDEMDLPEFTMKPSGTIPLTKMAESCDYAI